MSENRFAIEDGAVKKCTGGGETAVILEGLTEIGSNALEALKDRNGD